MKFLCPSCKARYQIADEKIAGRTVRMKCRKCSFVIPLNEVLPEPETIAPPDGELFSASAPPGPPSVPAPRPTSKPAPPPRPAAAQVAQATPMAPRPLPAPVRPSVRPVVAPAAVAPTPPAAELSPMAPPWAVPKLPPLPVLPDAGDADDEATPVTPSLARDARPVDSMAGDEWFVGARGAAAGPIRLSELRERARAGTITLQTLVWRDGCDDWRPLKTYPELVAIVEEGLSNVRAAVGPARNVPSPPPLDPDPFDDGGPSDPSGAALSANALASEDLVAAGLPGRRSSLAAWVAIVLALLLGLTIGFVVFGRQQPPERIVEYVTVPAAGPAAAGSAPLVPEGAASAQSEGATTSLPMTGARPAAGVASSKPAEGKPLEGLKGLAGLNAPDPGAPSAESTATRAAATELDNTQVSSTVARYTAGVKRSCWQPALDARDPGAPSSARVVVTITVAPSGSVQNVSTSGDPRGYPGLASCIASRVRGWQFPPSSASTTINVPFVFAAQ